MFSITYLSCMYCTDMYVHCTVCMYVLFVIFILLKTRLLSFCFSVINFFKAKRWEYLVVCEVLDLAPEYGVPAQGHSHILHHLRDLGLQTTAHWNKRQASDHSSQKQETSFRPQLTETRDMLQTTAHWNKRRLQTTAHRNKRQASVHSSLKQETEHKLYEYIPSRDWTFGLEVQRAILWANGTSWKKGITEEVWYNIQNKVHRNNRHAPDYSSLKQ